ncbi:hypothetical protein GIB67_017339 [Kingdonia uniflora]|uniref:SWIM-type domain-containing protein n=1 Tax=Kingdonia uniflora TaxID=39325 RepID=A0A7J7N5G9_9MAGN|nr:hypothetical protein GIB67_017339 [Kingdonia uniflora]
MYGVYVSYSTAWNAWTICMKRIVASYDEGYIVIPELTVQVLLANPGSISTCNIDLLTNEWTGTCISFKGSMEGWLNGCRPLLRLNGCFIKGKYGGVYLSIIGLDGNNGLFPIAVFFCRHMYKNMKKYHRGTHLEKLVWGVAKAWKQTEKEFLDQLKLDDPVAYDWLHREPYERWCRSHFNFSVKCERITNNFSESFNNWINKVRDKPLHKAIEKLNLMLMKLMYDRRLKAREWDQNGLVPRVVTYIEKMLNFFDLYRVEGTTDKYFVAIYGSGQKWKVNLENFECQCREWQLTGLPCVHAVCVIIPMRHPWIERCGKCGALGHMKKTCKGPSAQPSGTSTRQKNRLDTNISRAERRRNVGAPPKSPIVRGRGRVNSARDGRGSANSNNESGTSTNTGRGNGKNMGRVTVTRVRGTTAKTGNNATSNTERGAASNIGRGATSNIRRGAIPNNGRAPFQHPRPAPYVATQSSQTTSVTNPYMKEYQTPTRN